MKTIGIIVNTSKPRAADVLQKLSAKAESLGMTLLVDEQCAPVAGDMELCRLEAVFERAEAIMAVGGDGTMLRAVRAIEDRDLPLVGLNIGSLGFLTSIAEEDLGLAMECLAEDRFTISHRTRLECVLFEGERELARYRGLNDFVISGGASMRILTLDVSIDGDHVASYVCDGLVVATPTGSTGHSLSTGGPIMVPETGAFVISLICPHTLSSRPLVVSDASVIEIQGDCSDEDGHMHFVVDGQVGQPLTAQHRIVVKRSAEAVRFIHLPGYSYFSVLRQKMRWSGSTYR